MPSVLVLDRHPASCAELSRALAGAEFDVFAALSEEEALDILKSEAPAAAVVDLSAAETPDLSILARLKQEDPALGIVVLASREGVRTAVKALRHGACDFIPGPVRDEELVAAVARAAEDRNLRHEVARLRERLNRLLAFPSLIGKAPAFQEVLGLARRVAESSVTVLILGESGTGKDLLAQAIHHNGQRSQGPWVAVDCSAIPETLMESELFGHERGAFTGAERRKPGKFELAHGGTLFLDEVGNIPPAIQAKLLRVIESSSVTRLGGTRPVPVDVRILAATNTDLRAQVAAGKFREDLYYRLNVFTLPVPPLRERPQDIALLAEHFLREFASKHGRPVTGIDDKAMERLKAHLWPGNVRELRNVMERAVILADDRITEDLVLAAPAWGPAETGAPSSGLKAAMERAAARAAVTHIRQALDECGGNKTKAAGLLGVSVKTLYNLMHKYGI